MLVNAVVKMQWVAPHSLAQPDSCVQQRVWHTAYLAVVNIEALFTFRNNNPPARITAREATEQKLNILLEWPNRYYRVDQPTSFSGPPNYHTSFLLQSYFSFVSSPSPSLPPALPTHPS